MKLRSGIDNPKAGRYLHYASRVGRFSARRYTVKQEPTLAPASFTLLFVPLPHTQVSNYQAYNAFVSVSVHDRVSHQYRVNTSVNPKHYVIRRVHGVPKCD